MIEYIYFTEFGFSSKTEDNKHILMWDIDDTIINNALIQSFTKLQNKYNFGTVYLYKTRNGFHGICLDKFSFLDAKEIKIHSCYTDKLHDKISFKRGIWILRFGKDIKFIMKIPNDSYRQKSFAHKKFLNIYYGEHIIDNNFDILTNIIIEKYVKRKEKSEFKELLKNEQIRTI